MPIVAKLKKHGLLALVTLLSLGVLVWAVNGFRTKRAIHEAQELLQAGYAALAAERLDSIRHRVVETKEGCSILIGSYYRARIIDRLQWTAEACMHGGKTGIESLIALAGVQEFSGHNEEALTILSQALERYGPSPDVYYRIAIVHARGKNIDTAVRAFVLAASGAGANYQILMEALQYCSKTSHWKEASQIAAQLRTAPTTDPEVKLIIARALKNGGDDAGSKVTFDEAQTMLAAKPDQRKQLEKNYADLFKN